MTRRWKTNWRQLADIWDTLRFTLLPRWIRTATFQKRRTVGHFDGIFGNVALGWVWNPKLPDTPAAVEFLVNGRVIHTATAEIFRPDIAAAGHGSGVAGFIAELPIAKLKGVRRLRARLAGTWHELGGSPKRLDPATNSDLPRWLERRDRVTGRFRERLGERLARTVAGRRLSIIVPVYNTPPDWLSECLSSVVAQWCPNWELICVDDCSANPETRRVLDSFAGAHANIRVLRNAENLGIARATNVGIRAATGTHITFLDHDDCLEPDAVFHLLNAARTGAELICADEIVAGESLSAIRNPQLRPAFSWDYYINHPYVVHPICVETDLARAIGGWDEGMTISGDVDFVLRAIERARSVAHVPALLYRWRTHSASAGHALMDRVTEATTGALNRHLSRVCPGAHAVPTELFNHYEARFPDPGGNTLVIIPTKNRANLLAQCIDSLERTTQPGELEILVIDHESDDPKTIRYLEANAHRFTTFRYSGSFNYARMNNRAVAFYEERHGALPPFLLFSNNDIEAREAGWLGRMRSLAGRPDVGAVGATLLYPNDTVQHAGVVLGLHGRPADHAHRSAPFRNRDGRRNAGPMGMLVSTREYSAVTAAFLMMRAEVFGRVGGFDEGFTVGFNDTDLSLRVGQAGLKVLNDAASVLYHHESATRRAAGGVDHPEDDRRFHERWAGLLAEGDRFYNPLLGSHGPMDHRPKRFSVNFPKARVRPGLGRVEAGRAPATPARSAPASTS
ncbi:MULTISPECIES: glycosyltransferase [Methylobacterium]|uniref:glycosyltransferase n=1 Tax=Methylobacterium TaxID=407 RepID=UPI001044CD0B|nr:MULTISPECIES: glycosyltransferase [Methylobacterium]MDR7035291.1 GT2 family glycosyltransferase [Methylobacterium sp. BE186]